MALERCEYSRITIPNDKSYRDPVLKYVKTVAEKIGFTHREVGEISAGLQRAITLILEFSFEPGEKGLLEITCERIPRGFKIVIHDKGLPYDKTVLDTLIPAEGEAVADWMDDTLFNNLGADGKEIVLVKRLRNKDITDYYDACELEPYPPPIPEVEDSVGEYAFHVRHIEPDDAIQVSKCIYKTYGYTYPHEYVYYPEKLVELNEKGRIHSAVAVTENGKIAGHCALQYGEGISSVAELSQGVVIPEFRGKGCFARLTEYLVKRAIAGGMTGIYSQSVTNHTYSQREGHRFGFKDCGITLGVIPPSLEFKTMLAPSGGRISVLLQFRLLKHRECPHIFPPGRHREMISRIYQHLGLRVDLAQSPIPHPKETGPVFKTVVSETMCYARIFIKRYGNGLVQKIKNRVKELCLEKIEVIHLLLDLTDPETGEGTVEFENLGFFFAGVLPGGAGKGDALILQYLNNVAISYDEVRVDSDMASALIDYVGSMDPNRIG